MFLKSEKKQNSYSRTLILVMFLLMPRSPRVVNQP